MNDCGCDKNNKEIAYRLTTTTKSYNFTCAKELPEPMCSLVTCLQKNYGDNPHILRNV